MPEYDMKAVGYKPSRLVCGIIGTLECMIAGIGFLREFALGNYDSTLQHSENGIENIRYALNGRPPETTGQRLQ